ETAPSLALVDLRGISAMHLAYRPSQRLGRRRDHHQMGVIRHQAIGPDLDAEQSAPMGHEFEVEAVVFVGEERLLAAIAALSDVVRKTGDDGARDSGHDASVQKGSDIRRK